MKNPLADLMPKNGKDVLWALLFLATLPVSGLFYLMAALTTPRQLTITKEQVDETLAKWAQKGFMVMTRSKAQIILTRKKQFSFLLALVCLLACVLNIVLGVVLLGLYLLYFLAEKDEVLTIAVDHGKPAQS